MVLLRSKKPLYKVNGAFAKQKTIIQSKRYFCEAKTIIANNPQKIPLRGYKSNSFYQIHNSSGHPEFISGSLHLRHPEFISGSLTNMDLVKRRKSAP
jgi:hypothetical protein